MACRLLMLLFLPQCVMGAARGFAQTVSYDADLFPEETGDSWVHLDQVFPADRWIKDGWLFQHAEIVDPGPPAVGERDSYRRELDDQTGCHAWFLEWRMLTDGPQAFGAVAPAVIAAGGTSGIIYHFTIAEDRMRFLRGSQFPVIFADIEQNTPHVYRLDLRNSGPTGVYSFAIDGVLIDAGVAEGFYPTDDSAITFSARAAIEDSITRWDYIEFGFLPTGDMDEDGDVDVVDFEMFQSCVADGGPQAPTDPACWGADMDQDGDADFHDFAPFQRAFTGPK